MTQTTSPAKKEVFQEGTFWYNITYKVRKGQVSFKKVFWWYFAVKVVLLWLTSFIIGYLPQVANAIHLIYLIVWMQALWFSRKNVFHPLWFYVGFSTPVLWEVFIGIITVMFGGR